MNRFGELAFMIRVAVATFFVVGLLAPARTVKVFERPTINKFTEPIVRLRA